MMTPAVRTSWKGVFTLIAVAAATQAAAQPSLTVSIAPSPNRFDWNNTAVTISVNVALGKVLPDGHGGQLVMWSAGIGTQSLDHTVVRVIGERLIDFHLPALGPMILAQQDMGVTTDGRTLVAFDVTNGEIPWTHPAAPGGSFRIVTAVDGGGLTVATERGLEHFDRAGHRVLMADYSR